MAEEKENVILIKDEQLRAGVRLLLEGIDYYRPTEDCEAKNFGHVVAFLFRWNGVDILQCCAAALTDANYHRESEIVESLRVSLLSAESAEKP